MTKRSSNRQSKTGTGGRAEVRHPKPKFEREREEQTLQNPVRPLNAKQRTYMEFLETRDVIIATGFAGTSKTYLPTALACDKLRLGHLDKIIFSRPNVSNSKTLGAFAGSLEEKMANWLAPVLSVVKERIGAGALEVALKHGDIQFQPLETIKGLSVTDGWLIVDEAEDLSIDEVKKVITRVGKGSKLILAGDITQSELSEKSGLRWLIGFVQRNGLSDIVGHVDFNNPNEIVRSEAVKRFVIAMNKEAKGEKGR